jgi:hypothetical protein
LCDSLWGYFDIIICCRKQQSVTVYFCCITFSTCVISCCPSFLCCSECLFVLKFVCFIWSDCIKAW